MEALTGQSGTWTVMAAPSFPLGPEEVTAHAVDPGGSRWWVTNGKAVLRSPDRGCTWFVAYRLPAEPSPDAPLSAATDRISAVVVPEAADARDRVYATVEVLAETSPAVPVAGAQLPPDGSDRQATFTVVLVSADAGRTWSAAGPLAQPAGPPGPLRVAPGDPEFVYAVAGGVLNASEDGGSTWQARPLPAETSPNPDQPDLVPLAYELAVDPLWPHDVWVRNQSWLLHSKDGGRSWTKLSRVGGPHLHGPDIVHHPRGAPRLVLTRSEDLAAPIGAVFVSRDGGASWLKDRVDNVKGYHQSMAHGAGDEVIVTTFDAGLPAAHPDVGVYRLEAGQGRLVDIDEWGLAPLFDVQADRSPTPAFYFRTPATLVVYEPPGPRQPGSRRPEEGTATIGGIPLPPGVDLPAGPARAPATLTPADAEVRISPGESASVPYTLALPAQPTPLDVFFLVDTSGSMEPTITNLAEAMSDITRRLTAAGVDAQFGLGEFQGIQKEEVRYRRRVDIRPPDRRLQQELASLRTRGGEEPHLTALHQMATGSGIPDPSVGDPVPPGRQANWRKGSLRVVVMPTDEAFGTDPDGPGRDATVAALRAKGIRHVGIEVDAPVRADRVDEEAGVGVRTGLRQQLEDLSAATGALAPEGGVDCDGNGRAEIREGEPLVCSYSPDVDVALADVLSRLLLSLVDRQPVALVPRDAGDIGVRVEPPGGYELNVKVDHRARFTATFSCTEAQTGTAHPVVLAARVGEREVADATARVVCGDLAVPATLAPPAAPTVAAPSAPPVLPAPVAAPAPAPSVAQAQALQGAQVEAGQAAQAAQGAPVAAVVPAEEPVPATQRAGRDDRDALQAVARPRERPTAGVAVPAGMALWAAAVAALRRRTRPAPARLPRT